MKIRTLNFYDGFKCIAGECKHNCCVGWEIDIDEDSLNNYRALINCRKRNNRIALSGKLSEEKSGKNLERDRLGLRIKKGVNFRKRRFKMKKRRCSFLNENNLCDLILKAGENALCTVCREHPRYRTYSSEFIDFGYGLCCDKAADLIIDFNKAPSEVIRENNSKKADYEEIFNDDNRPDVERTAFSLGRKVCSFLFSDNCSFNQKICKILDCIGVNEKSFFGINYKKTLLKCEVLYKSWKKKVKRANFINRFDFSESDAIKYRNIFIYFIHRHIGGSTDEWDAKTRILFAVFGVYVINCVKDLYGEGVSALKEAAINFSAEIEYSENNFYKILNVLEELV